MIDKVRRIQKGKSCHQALSGSQSQQPTLLTTAATRPWVPFLSNLKVSGSQGMASLRSLGSIEELVRKANSQAPTADLQNQKFWGWAQQPAFCQALQGNSDAHHHWSTAVLPHPLARNS